MGKAVVRADALAIRRGLGAAQLQAWNAAIRAHLWGIPEFSQAKCVLAYVASKDNEVETRPIIEDALGRRQTVLVPRASTGGVLEWCRLESLHHLSLNRWGIWEPKPEIPAETPPPHSVCLVPGIAFRQNGHRIGYGGGFYDRFLQGHAGLSVGLAYGVQVRDDWKPETHDIAVNLLVTENGVLRPQH